MKLFYSRFLESCCSNKDAAFSPVKLKSGDIDFHSLRHQYNLPFAGFNHAVNAASDDLFPVRWSKDDMRHSDSYLRSAGASPRSKIDSADSEMPWSSSYSMLESMESLAVVKRSENPRADFRRSMGEMVMQKGIYKVAELEQLLHCFLSLNSHHHHLTIVKAFADMWEELFPVTPDGRRNTGPTGCQDP
ncbi:transcription repressor OFP7-like [Dendrobium catenatum]|uniref:Transcription repressor n=1 Tax=Dendrobium catenatum TaxID=906689 RepID=A0A2I0V9L6_9ASPA|nr:transcription repressor OFP7-like [Dendrobium catenatum]PKU60090.1 hypothetical protein MA16_Dca028264 [Dendrobium catenatum]